MNFVKMTFVKKSDISDFLESQEYDTYPIAFYTVVYDKTTNRKEDVDNRQMVERIDVFLPLDEIVLKVDSEKDRERLLKIILDGD